MTAHPYETPVRDSLKAQAYGLIGQARTLPVHSQARANLLSEGVALALLASLEPEEYAPPVRVESGRRPPTPPRAPRKKEPATEAPTPT